MMWLPALKRGSGLGLTWYLEGTDVSSCSLPLKHHRRRRGGGCLPPQAVVSKGLADDAFKDIPTSESRFLFPLQKQAEAQESGTPSGNQITSDDSAFGCPNVPECTTYSSIKFSLESKDV
ncbi:hypothetical protein EYF80_043792 [Liparis tanakae]|uniref:Uncharacterized protein n=1 Tax=Liparis tanakae TaxID=230148 RepID=A0A4Z2FZ59_9TELE|nr:hypothetical protein EYF80_043792 [Liparis tanakae]